MREESRTSSVPAHSQAAGCHPAELAPSELCRGDNVFDTAIYHPLATVLQVAS